MKEHRQRTAGWHRRATFLAIAAAGVAGAGCDSAGVDPEDSFVPDASARQAPPPEPAAVQRARRHHLHLIAVVRRAELLYARPDGRPVVRIARLTQWRSPRVLAVVERRPGWLRVVATELRNGRTAWLPERRARLGTTAWELRADVGRRRLVVRRGRRVLRRMAIAVGSPAHPTPRGTYSVTDRLRVTDPGSVYGCCVLALSGHQVRLPANWAGGDRLAVHATTATGSIGRAVSLGCMRVATADARWLIRRVPLGAPVYIR